MNSIPTTADGAVAHDAQRSARSHHYLAIDLGAESGRLMLGSLDGGTLSLEELHRFPNTPLKVDDSLHWNMPVLWNEVKAGLRKAAALKLPIASISTDSWGLDYVLFDAQGGMMPPAFHYRDARTARGVERVRSLVPWPEVFAETGIQFMPFNTIYQLAAETPGRLARAKQLLPVADAFNYLLCGVARAEESLASTTQLYNPLTRNWSSRLLKSMQFPPALFPPIVPSGTRLGPLRPEVASETGLASIEVIASCSHDTGAAVAAIPARGRDRSYISSGTWSLMGVEIERPLLNENCRAFNFTNEIGYGGSVRLLKNIVGLWIVQECRREWARQGLDFDYAKLMHLAKAAPPFVSLISPDDPRFIAPGEMPDKISAFCRETKQPVPPTPGATIRCVLESLALLYCETFLKLEELAAHKIEGLHIVGGGSQSVLLNQFTANSTGVPVLAGPVEATALGNVIVQAISQRHFASLAAARETVRSSFTLADYMPVQRDEWNAAAERFAKLTTVNHQAGRA